MAVSENQIQAFKGFLEVDDLPDFTIKIGGYKWRVHSSVLSQKSKFFEKICCGPFKEAQEREVTLHDDCPWIVGRMLEFFYFGSYDGYDNTKHSSQSSEISSGQAFERPIEQTESVTTENTIENTMHWTEELSKIMEVGQPGPEHDMLKLGDAKRDSLTIGALLFRLARKYEIPDLLEICTGELKHPGYLSKDPVEGFLMILDVLGVDSWRCEPALLWDMTSSISWSFIMRPDEYPRIKDLLATDEKFLMLMIDSLHQDFRALQRRKK